MHLITMISISVHDLCGAGCQHGREPFQSELVLSTADDFRLGIALFDRGSGEFDQFAVFGSAHTVFPTPDTVRFVPDLIPVHLARVAFDYRGHIAAPRRAFLPG